MKHITAIFLILSSAIFILFVALISRYSTITKVISPTVFEISTSSNKSAHREKVCADSIETFSLNLDEKIINKYSQQFDISSAEVLGLGFLAQEYAQKLMQNRKVTIKHIQNENECKRAKIKINGMDYSTLMANSGFGIVNGEIANKEKFNINLKNAKKLDLVILNHHSDKYHTPNCPYGLAAHDSVIIPKRQLPANVIPCKFCHNIENYKIPKKNNTIIELNKIIHPSLLKTDGNIKMIFTDNTKILKPNNDCSSTACKEVLKLINETKSNLDIAIYGYENNKKITEALYDAKRRGVNIRFVYDESYNPESTFYKDNNIIKNLATESRSDSNDSKTSSNMIMHNKFFISDNKKVFTGSMNISRSGLSDFDINHIIIIDSEDIASLYKAEFEQMLNGRFHKNKIKHNLNNRFVLNNSEIEVYFSPQDKATARIIEIINNAKNYIYAPTFLITNRNIAQALLSAKAKGVDVRILIDANGATTSHTKLQELRNAGILIKTENFAGKLHSKSIIADGEYIITGSMNFSYSGADKNDENTLIIKNKELEDAYKTFFLYLWTIVPNKYLKFNAHPESPDSPGSCSDGIDNNFNGKVDMQEESCKIKN